MLKRFLLTIVAIALLLPLSVFADEPSEPIIAWSEADFAFYNPDMTIYKKPVAGKSMSYYVSLEEEETAQTYRGIKIGSFPEELLGKYDMSDAEWSIYDTDKEAVRGETERSKALTEKWKAEGKTGADVLAMSDFLCSKGYYFYIKLYVYRQNGIFLSRSQLQIEDAYENIKNNDVSKLLSYSWNESTREELEKMFDEWYAQASEEERNYYLQNCIYYFCRADFQFRIENGVITWIELSDHYYSALSSAYNDDGTINEAYAYVLDLK